MTSEELDEIEKRANAATEGPWRSYVSGINTVHVASGFDLKGGPLLLFEHDKKVAGREWRQDQSVYDSNFVAAAREDVPALVARVRQLEAEKAAILDRIEELEKENTHLMIENESIRFQLPDPTSPTVAKPSYKELESQCAAMREALDAIVRFNPTEIVKDDFAYDRLVDTYRYAAQKILSTSSARKDFEGRLREKVEREFDSNAAAIRHWALVEGFKEGVEACATYVESLHPGVLWMGAELRKLKRSAPSSGGKK